KSYLSIEITNKSKGRKVEIYNVDPHTYHNSSLVQLLLNLLQRNAEDHRQLRTALIRIVRCDDLDQRILILVFAQMLQQKILQVPGDQVLLLHQVAHLGAHEDL